METFLDQRFGFLVTNVGRLFGKRFDDLATSSLDLTRAQCRVLAYVMHYGNINQARLAELLEVTPISAGRILDRMEQECWVERMAAPNDRRARQVRLTAKGQMSMGTAVKISEQVAEEALMGFDEQERVLFISMLSRAQANLSRIVDEPCEGSIADGKDGRLDDASDSGGA